MARRNGWERYFVTKYKATSNLIWSVLRSANAHFFLVFYRFLFRFYVYILGLVWIPSKMRGDSLSHSRAARTHTTDEKSTREHIQISNKWRRSRIYMHALFETKNRIAIFALHLHCSHLDQCSTELCSGVFFFISFLSLVLLLLVRKQSKLNDLIYCHLYFPFRLFVQY